MLDPRWLPMALAPKDRRVSIRAERWVKRDEFMRVEVFTGCRWSAGGTVRHPAPYWQRVPSGWKPTHWCEADADAAAAA